MTALPLEPPQSLMDQVNERCEQLLVSPDADLLKVWEFWFCFPTSSGIGAICVFVAGAEAHQKSSAGKG